jgi:hypothetical protein
MKNDFLLNDPYISFNVYGYWNGEINSFWKKKLLKQEIKIT